MSIATLKRKTQAQYNNSSVGQPAFSLNGTRRSQGYVGQTSLSRSLPRTLMNGPTPRGHGGCCGQYYNGHIIQSAVTSLNNPNVIKNSVINTTGMINEKLNCLTNVNEKYFISCGPKHQPNIVKPQTIQFDYITNKAKKAILCANLPSNTSKIDTRPKICQPCNTNSFFSRGPKYVTHTKPKSQYVPISQSEYLVNLDNTCITNDKKHINTQVKKSPLPGPPASY